MNKTLKEILTTRYELISSLIAQLENKMALLPDGRITVRQIQNNSYYYLKADGSENILALKDAQPLIEDIIQKQYYEKVLKVSKQESKALRNVLAHYPEKTAEDIYSDLSEERQKFVKPIIPTTEQFVKETRNIKTIMFPGSMTISLQVICLGIRFFYHLNHQRLRSM